MKEKGSLTERWKSKTKTRLRSHLNRERYPASRGTRRERVTLPTAHEAGAPIKCVSEDSISSLGACSQAQPCDAELGGS